MFKKCLAILVALLSFTLTCFAMEMESNPIVVDEDTKTITLEGNESRVLFLIEGKMFVELESFTKENSGFDWERYKDKKYKIIVKNTNILMDSSVDFLLWLQKHEFHITLESSCYISSHGLEKFSDDVAKRTDDSFADVLFKLSFPIENGYRGYGRMHTIQRCLKLKGYTFETDC